MKKVFFFSLTLLTGHTAKAHAENLVSDADSLRLEQLNEVVINGVRAHETSRLQPPTSTAMNWTATPKAAASGLSCFHALPVLSHGVRTGQE